jgi:hypothetical protein
MSALTFQRIAGAAVRATLALIVTLAPVACGIHHRDVPGREENSARLPRSETRYILRADQFPRAGSTYDVIARLRPDFLRARAGDRGLQSPVLPAMYLDGVQLDVSMLQQVPIAWVLEIQYLHATVASARFGRKHEAGAIVVTTGRPSP